MTLRSFFDRLMGRTPPSVEPDAPPRVFDLDPGTPVTWGGSHPVGFDPANRVPSSTLIKRGRSDEP